MNTDAEADEDGSGGEAKLCLRCFTSTRALSLSSVARIDAKVDTSGHNYKAREK